MSPLSVSAEENEGVFKTIRLMCVKSIRRIPVVTHEGGLEGIVPADNILDLQAEEIAELAMF
jgi:predicted transcriptional regulator